MTAHAAKHTLWPRQTIHLPGFFLSLVWAPLFVTLVTCWLIVPVFALVLGGPLYLALGTPALLWLLSRRRYSAGEIACFAFAVHLLACLLALAFALATQDDNLRRLAATYLMFGALFAPLWGLAFGWFYNGFLPQLPKERTIQ